MDRDYRDNTVAIMSTPLMCSEHKTDRMSKIWRQFEILLEEAVQKNSYIGAEMLLEHEAMLESRTAERHPTKYKQKCTIPIILAAENGNFQMLKLFLKYHYIIPQPHVTDCNCDECYDDKLGQARYRLSILKALSNPLYIALTSDDPFLTSFKLYHLNRNFGNQDDSFEQVYELISHDNVNLCVKLLDEIKAEREGALLMRHKTFPEDKDSGSDLSFINLAVGYCQKEVVAHPVTQHFLTSRVFDKIPGWRRSGIMYKVLFVLFTGILFPVTTLLNVFFPCWTSIGSIAMKPFVKFINGAASFITFLVLLAVLGTTVRSGVRSGTCPTDIEIAVFVWLIGFCYGEFQQLYKRGIADYLSNGWNWVDIGMDTLMMFSFITWIILCFHSPGNPHLYDTVIYLADGAFALAIILSFFRVIYLCQITSYLGLLQLCLGEMIMVILQFAFICIIVLLSFTIAMVFLFHASAQHEEITEKYEQENANRTGIYLALSENFNGFWATLFTMGWVSFSMKDTETVADFADGTLIHLWANLLFIVYFGITMIIVLNMLIAMMNNSYQVIADNLTREHKYSRTSLWLEYIGDEQTRPVPFNLIPSFAGIKKFFACIWNIVRHCQCSSEMKSKNPTLEKDARRKYKQLCDLLMDRYVLKEYGFSIYDDQPHVIQRNHNDPFLQKVLKNFEVWRIYQETGEYNHAALHNHVDYSAPPMDKSASTTPQSQQLYISDDGDDATPVWKDFLVL